MPNGEESDGEHSRHHYSVATGAVPDARLVLPCVIQSIILLLLPIAAAPAVAQEMLFPRGPSDTVPFTEGNIGDYELAVSHDGNIVDPSEVLLSVTPVQGTGFVVTPRRGVTTTEFVTEAPQFSWTRIKGESDVEGGGGHGWSEEGEESGVGADGGSPEGDRSRRRRRGGWGGGLGARAAVEREPETGRGSAAAARRIAGDGLARSRGRALSPGGVAGAGAGRSRARSEGAGR